MSELPQACREALAGLGERGRLVVITGAGISAESGLPTFRGPEGYWTVGSTRYRPQDLATRAAFGRLPAEVWGWYLHRRSVYRRAEPNAAHRALAALDQRLGGRMLLATQNVDGLHRRAGSPAARTLPIHGDIEVTRCADGCGAPPAPLPDGLPGDWPRDRIPGAAEAALLRCSCGGWRRPHVLWFDEFYDEENFHFDTALAAASRCDLLLVVGSSGSTNLPLHMAGAAARRGTPLVVVDPDPTVFGRLGTGWTLTGGACEWVPAIADAVTR